MGGTPERIRVFHTGAAKGAAKRLDAAKSQCFLSRDRHKMLGVIEASFGSLAPFNRTVRRVMKESDKSQDSVHLGESSHELTKASA